MHRKWPHEGSGGADDARDVPDSKPGRRYHHAQSCTVLNVHWELQAVLAHLRPTVGCELQSQARAHDGLRRTHSSVNSWPDFITFTRRLPNLRASRMALKCFCSGTKVGGRCETLVKRNPSTAPCTHLEHTQCSLLRFPHSSHPGCAYAVAWFLRVTPWCACLLVAGGTVCDALLMCSAPPRQMRSYSSGKGPLGRHLNGRQTKPAQSLVPVLYSVRPSALP